MIDQMRSLPDILTSTQFWSSVATVGAASGVWFTFFGTTQAARRKAYEDVLSLIRGIEAELELVGQWASGGDDDSGYLQSTTREEQTRKHEDWFNPSRKIFSFDTPSLQTFTTSVQLHQLKGIVEPLVRLNYSIHRLFDLHTDLRTFVNSHPSLYDGVVKKLATRPSAFTPEERVFMNIVFEFNQRIHKLLIGGADSTDDLCLYRSFRAARKAVSDFKIRFHREAQPWWYWPFHFVALCLALNAIWQVLRWFRVIS
jgi:hypothetical protein